MNASYEAPLRPACSRSWPLVGLLCLAMFVCLAGARGQSSNTPSFTLDDVSHALASAKTVFAHFVQERHMSLFDEPLRSEGQLCFEQPGRVRWEVTLPYKSILVSDGAGVVQFEWVDDKWKRLDMGLAGAMQNVVSQIAGIMRGQYARQSGQQTVTLSNSPQGPVVTLVPRNEKMSKMIQAIEVHLAPDLKATRKVVLRENDGDFTSIEFDQQAVNLKFPDHTFDLNAPLELEQVRQVAAKGSH